MTNDFIDEALAGVNEGSEEEQEEVVNEVNNDTKNKTNENKGVTDIKEKPTTTSTKRKARVIESESSDSDTNTTSTLNQKHNASPSKPTTNISKQTTNTTVSATLPKSTKINKNKQQDDVLISDKEAKEIERLKKFVVLCGLRKLWGVEFKGMSGRQRIARLKQLLVEGEVLEVLEVVFWVIVFFFVYC